MSSARKIIQAAAGNIETAVEPVGIDFDGTNDYLSRSSDLVGNADGKTFTLSLWQYRTGVTGSDASVYRIEQGGSLRGFVSVRGSGELRVGFYNSGGSQILNFQTNSSEDFAFNTWTHYLLSVDMTDQAATKCYKNDEAVTFTQSVFTNDNIDFTCNEHLIKSLNGSSGDTVKQRLAGVYLDYSYRDLSVEANRRDFIDADGSYVTPPTSGIISVPMDDPEDPGRNDGTGGDFTLNGTIAQSGRGPNQYNAPASTFDGSADYIYNNTTLSLPDSPTVTGHFYAKPKIVGSGDTILAFYTGGSDYPLMIYMQSDGRIIFDGYQRLDAEADNVFIRDKWVSVQFSFDLTDSSKRHVIIDGEAASVTYSTYTSGDFRFSSSGADTMVANDVILGFTSPFNGELSDLWFDTTYIDLSADNPFYDTETGKPKDLGVDGSNPTGSAPLIYLPLRADDAGSNKGTGGDFTVNSGPYVGARGPSEFWGESAEFNGSTQYLSRSSALTGASDGKVFSFACSFYSDDISSVFRLFSIETGATNDRLVIYSNASRIFILARDGSESLILYANTPTSSISAGQWTNLLIHTDMSNTANRGIYINGVQQSVTWSNYSDSNVLFSEQSQSVGADVAGANYWNGKIGFLWFNTEYIDFSQEANRLKFFDAFGYPVDLGEDGSLPTGNQPLIYMNNDFHLGTNLGSGGDFTPQNTPTDGGFVRG